MTNPQLLSYSMVKTESTSCKIRNEISARFGSTYTKVGTIQRRLAWPLRKDDTQIREAFHIFLTNKKKKKEEKKKRRKKKKEMR